MKKFLLFLLIVALCIAVIAAILSTVLKNSDEIQSKREWSILQVLRHRYQEEQLNTRIIIEQLDEFYAAGILSDDDNSSRVWILLNPNHLPLIKELPSQNYHIRENELEHILSEAEVSDAIETHLSLKIQ